MGINRPDPRTTFSCRKSTENRRYRYETKIQGGRGRGEEVKEKKRKRKEMQERRGVEMV